MVDRLLLNMRLDSFIELCFGCLRGENLNHSRLFGGFMREILKIAYVSLWSVPALPRGFHRAFRSFRKHYVFLAELCRLILSNHLCNRLYGLENFVRD